MANDLFKRVIDLTELPHDQITQELEKLLEKEGVSTDRVTLSELREALAQYIHDVFAQYELLSSWNKEAADDEEDERVADPTIKLFSVH